MDTNLSPLVVMTMGSNFWRKVFYSIGIFLFFPLAWLNHFRLLPGNALFHYGGFLILIVLSIFLIKKVYDDKRINSEFVIQMLSINVVVTLLNLIIYIVAWIFVGGPGFKFFGKYVLMPRIFLLIVYIFFLAFNILIPIMMKYIEDWDEPEKYIDEEELLDKEEKPISA